MKPRDFIKKSDELNAIPYEDCLAKTFTTVDGRKLKGRSVFNHCQIVGEVAKEILARFPKQFREALFPEGSELAAAAHDIGKVSPTFQEKILRGATDTGYQWNSHSALVAINPEIEKNWGGHAGVSQITADSVHVGKYIPEILGQHHGYSPTISQLATDQAFGGELWQQERLRLTNALKQNLNIEWPTINNVTQARVIAGLTSVADWIGSGPFFENPDDEWQSKIKDAVDNAGFIFPQIRAGLRFDEIFGFLPKDTQIKFIDTVNQPGVYILEAPMGLGKTEAALYAAYKIISTGQATGLYFALPTQLTSNKIHDRVNTYLEKILDESSLHKKSLLLHANAWLKEMGEEGQPGGAWFNNSKRGILAPFAVGTIDQALMAVMNVKHGFVRAFGLVGKVVVLDEVHSYDVYTGTILDTLVSQLIELGCTVIILSATLTYDRRKKLLNSEPCKNDYPLISAITKEKKLQEIATDASHNQTVAIKLMNNTKACIDEAIIRAQKGQQVLWIENTVKDSQDAYKLFSARATGLGVECGLLHSRFLKVDREKNEQKWVDIFGKDESSVRTDVGRILVGTQVLEQSLDIDADFLVTRFCPTDMLFQRMGRLWRHARKNRNPAAQCEAWVIAPQLDAAVENPEKEFASTAWVYNPYILCRSLEVWKNTKQVHLPNNIRTFIEATYAERKESERWFKLLYELENGSTHNGIKKPGRKQMEQMALIGISAAGKTLPESKATTRYSEQDTVDCLLLAAYPQETADKKSTTIKLLSGEIIHLPKNGKSLPKKVWREYAAKIAQNTVLIGEYKAPAAAAQESLGWLKDYFYLGNQHDDESKLRVAVVKPNGELKSIAVSENNKFRFEYDSLMGYQIISLTKDEKAWR